MTAGASSRWAQEVRDSGSALWCEDDMLDYEEASIEEGELVDDGEEDDWWEQGGMGLANALSKSLQDLQDQSRARVQQWEDGQRRRRKAQEQPPSLPADPGCPGRGRTALTRVRRLRGALALAVAAALSIAVVGLTVHITVLKESQCSEQPQTKGAQSSAAEPGKDGRVLPPCGDGGIWYRNKCFYFSEDEGDWTEAEDSCAALNSSLALVDTREELDFMLRYKGTRYRWIGLQRESNQQWKWFNGTEFNNWFLVADYSECAYLGNDRVKSVECYHKCKWICTQVSAYG